MTDAEFFQGWSFLLVQPWARMYTYGEDAQAKEAVQIGIYKSKFKNLDGARWIAVCLNWAEHLDHWPSVSDLSQRLLLIGGAPKALALPAPIEPASADYPPRLAYDYSSKHGCSYRDACLKVLPGWIASHPDHADLAKTQALLASMRQALAVPKRVVHAVTQDAPYEFVTDAKAEGLSRCCKSCKSEQPTTVYVCWCEKWEGCKACYLAHEPKCPGIRSTFGRRKK